MPTSEQLVWRAQRMLHDGRQHSKAALAWARAIVEAQRLSIDIQSEEAGTVFTLRELSLGAAEVVSL